MKDSNDAGLHKWRGQGRHPGDLAREYKHQGRHADLALSDVRVDIALSGMTTVWQPTRRRVNSQCRARIPALHAGANLTVLFAHVPALAGGAVAMSIAIDRRQVYVATPEQVIYEYSRSSRRRLLDIPGGLLFALAIASPLFFFDRFAKFFSPAA